MTICMNLLSTLVYRWYHLVTYCPPVPWSVCKLSSCPSLLRSRAKGGCNHTLPENDLYYLSLLQMVDWKYINLSLPLLSIELKEHEYAQMHIYEYIHVLSIVKLNLIKLGLSLGKKVLLLPTSITCCTQRRWHRVIE